MLCDEFVDVNPGRRTEVLDEVKAQHLKVDDMVSESASGLTYLSAPQCGLASCYHKPPTPSSHLARFTAHTDTISSVLDDVRPEQLEQCIASLTAVCESNEIAREF